MIRITTATCAALTCLLLSVASPVTAQDDDDDVRMQDDDDDDDDDDDEEFEDEFLEMDANKNGTIEQDEAEMSPREFRKMDRDGNKSITRQELQAFEIEERVNELFVEHDADLSGTLSKREVPEEFAESFKNVDANKDGQISGKEALAYLKDEARREIEGEADSEDLGALIIRACTKAQAKTLTAKTFPASKTLFKAVDANADGKVTRKEAVAFRRRGVEMMERVWQYEWRSEEAKVSRDGFAVLIREADWCFHAGRFDPIPELAKEIKARYLRARAAKRGNGKRMRSRRTRDED